MVNAYCYYYGDDSWSRHARSFFGAWQKQEPVRILSWNPPSRAEAALPPSDEPSPRMPGIGLGPIELMPTVSGKPRIAFVVWETTILPRDKAMILQSMDQVWVPSTWGREVLIANGLAAAKVHVVPEGVDVDRFRPMERPHDPNRPFRFLFVGKWEERKGVELLIRAYRKEFARTEPVELVLHAWNPYLRGFDLDRQIRRALGLRRAPPIVASTPIGEDALVQLYNSCDAFVLPTRAEAWGLPITEAMACGLPVIATAYSAPLDYLDQSTGYLIDVRKLIAVRDPYFFPDGHLLGRWAQPDERSLRKQLRRVFENRDEAREKGRQARDAVCARWTWDHAASRARQVLREGA